ncbi:MAG: 2-amino-4-hydroxy-6-hydroxymethyldihydropteridine diphosphokinase [Deltaproteobacteria bacterium]|nr:2-amino-4-hydroxy-6-hydroxymethyldihydropteridine diphosphokinase [Deltaproteobacteria bacterium]
MGNTDDLRGFISYIGVGSNMSEPAKRCLESAERIDEIGGVKVLRESSLYRTEPVGITDQDWFVNAVIEIRTILTPKQLLIALKQVEDDMGRKESTRWGPRIIDLDILLYSQEIVQEESLRIPHPELHKRRFVLAPLCEIASYVIHPAFGISMRGLLDRLEDNHIVEMI